MNWLPLLLPVAILAAFVFVGLRVISGKWPKAPTPERDAKKMAAWEKQQRHGFWRTYLLHGVMPAAGYFFAGGFVREWYRSGTLLLSFGDAGLMVVFSLVVGFVGGGLRWVMVRSEGEAAIERAQKSGRIFGAQP